MENIDDDVGGLSTPTGSWVCAVGPRQKLQLRDEYREVERKLGSTEDRKRPAERPKRTNERPPSPPLCHRSVFTPEPPRFASLNP